MSEHLSKVPDTESIARRIKDSRVVQFVLNTEQRPMLEVEVHSYEGSATSVLFPDATTYPATETQRDELLDFIAD